jgi:hypothetical protein
MSGRTGLYGAGHREQMKAVLRMQGEGFTLRALRALLAAWERGETLEDLLGLPRRPRSGGGDGGRRQDVLDPFDEFVGTRRPVGKLLSAVPSPLIDGVIDHVAS